MNRYLLFNYIPQDGPEKTMRCMPKSLKGNLMAIFCFVLFYKCYKTLREDAAKMRFLIEIRGKVAMITTR